MNCLCVVYNKSYCSIEANKYDLKNGKGVTSKFGDIILAQKETVSRLLFWNSFSEHFLHHGGRGDFERSDGVVGSGQVLHQDEKEDDHKGKKEAEKEPDVDELHVRRCRQL